MKQKNIDKYTLMTTAPVPRLIGSLAVPTIISMLITSFYVMADTYFVGKINTQSTAAVGISFSVMAIIQAFGFFFGHGSGNYISRKLGAREYQSAEKMASTGFFCAFIAGTLITVFGLIFLSPICKALGSTSTILPYSETYLGIILLGAPFMASSLVLNNQMRFQGNAVYAMIGIIVGAVLNIGLDPLLIFVFDMGIAGAGIATLASQICSFIILLYMDRKGENIRIRFSNFTPKLSLLKEILYGGSPSLCRQGLASTATILLNVAAGRYGDAAIAGMSIVTRICMFINSFVIGFGQGFQPVCGFNYGAGFYTRVRHGFWFCIKLGVIFLSICSIIGYIYAPEIVSWFRKEDAQVIEIGARALRWQLITLPLGTWVILCNMLLQTIRKPVRAVILSSARQGLFFIPFILILPYLLGLQGVEMCQAAADLCSFLLAIPLTIGVLKGMREDHPQAIQDNVEG
ncbi:MULTISPECIES: MATE family efflux transporter [Phocaeicola]|jgi:putative MATE family efflux protein|uniref:Multidrug export protein MepA n=1 Tax=Phocaeicola acetigenes TaxID=3016083 RepID=A0ABT4PHK2_9BACT|nr:MATE family efflux transporter [Phocaeicola sp. KGMB11183]MCZ8372527.1 MATE family efflux transporter [Phocaeicola sp. KGMB11183]